MVRNAMKAIFAGFLLLNISGCFALFAGAVGGAATAVWLSGKMTQQFEAPFEKTVEATESALKSYNYPINRQTQSADAAAYKSTYSDGREIWIDVKKITDTATKVEVRVGGVHPDKVASSDILSRIQSYL